MSAYKDAKKKKSYADTVKNGKEKLNDNKKRGQNSRNIKQIMERKTPSNQDAKKEFSQDPLVKQQLDMIKECVNELKKAREVADQQFADYKKVMDKLIEEQKRRKAEKEKEFKEKQMDIDNKKGDNSKKQTKRIKESTSSDEDKSGVSDDDINNAIMRSNVVIEGQQQTNTMMNRLFNMLGGFSVYNTPSEFEGDEFGRTADDEAEESDL